MTHQYSDCRPDSDLAEWFHASLRLCAGVALLAIEGYAITAAISLILG